jgi:hypothetical protein
LKPTLYLTVGIPVWLTSTPSGTILGYLRALYNFNHLLDKISELPNSDSLLLPRNAPEAGSGYADIDGIQRYSAVPIKLDFPPRSRWVQPSGIRLVSVPLVHYENKV